MALSQGMRRLIPLKRLVDEVTDALDVKDSVSYTTRTQVYEDNNGCLILANSKLYTPRTQHYSVKYFWFREKLQQYNIKVVRIDTKEQLADLGTKSLPASTFQYLRKKLCGW